MPFIWASDSAARRLNRVSTLAHGRARKQMGWGSKRPRLTQRWDAARVVSSEDLRDEGSDKLGVGAQA